MSFICKRQCINYVTVFGLFLLGIVTSKVKASLPPVSMQKFTNILMQYSRILKLFPGSLRNFNQKENSKTTVKWHIRFPKAISIPQEISIQNTRWKNQFNLVWFSRLNFCCLHCFNSRTLRKTRKKCERKVHEDVRKINLKEEKHQRLKYHFDFDCFIFITYVVEESFNALAKCEIVDVG